MSAKYIVTLTADERAELTKLVHTGTAPARVRTHAQILLKADCGSQPQAQGPAWTDQAIQDALDVGSQTIHRVRQCFVEQGVDAALHRRRPTGWRERKLDGEGEAHLLALACSTPPTGREHWSLRLLADKLVTLGYVDEVSHETVRSVLEKNEIKPWLKEEYCIPPDSDADFVYHMEDVLDLYTAPYDPTCPLVCFDETNKQLIGESRLPLPVAPGLPARVDYEYVRNGVSNLFMFFAPLENWREVVVTAHRTKMEFALCMRDLVDRYFPDAVLIRVVMDNLNTHDLSALYEVFEPTEARRIISKLEIHYTPKHGSWLNMAEIELSVLSNQCLDRRIPDQERLAVETGGWVAERNTAKATVEWRFTTADARIKLKKLYPTIKAQPCLQSENLPNAA
jgi:DDE superfamily endonuclease/Homeodomain-like domain